MFLDTSTPAALALAVLQLRTYLDGPPVERAALHRGWFTLMPYSERTRVVVAAELQVQQSLLSVHALIN